MLRRSLTGRHVCAACLNASSKARRVTRSTRHRPEDVKPMNKDDLRELLVLVINRQTMTLRAEALEEEADVIAVEAETGELFFLQIQRA